MKPTRYKDRDGKELYDGDLVMAVKWLSPGYIGYQVVIGTLGVYCSSENGEQARVAWAGAGLRTRVPFDCIKLYEPKSFERPDVQHDDVGGKE
jgi:hypothetical protein